MTEYEVTIGRIGPVDTSMGGVRVRKRVICERATLGQEKCTRRERKRENDREKGRATCMYVYVYMCAHARYGSSNDLPRVTLDFRVFYITVTRLVTE